jgi:hypothetical protein
MNFMVFLARLRLQNTILCYTRWYEQDQADFHGCRRRAAS